jgi:phage baseplate assembly protein W
MANLQKIYSDIDFTFAKKPVVGDVALSYDTQAVIRSIRNILLTNHYEKLFDPDFGSNIDALLFENFSPITSGILENEIATAIKNYEPRAILKNVNVVPDEINNAYSVTLSFYLQNSATATTISLLLERNR